MESRDRTSTPQGLCFQSSDSRFGLLLPSSIQRMLERECAARFPNETGGILLGRYSSDLRMALVSHITQQPADSKSGRTWFERGVSGLQKLIDRLWKKQEFYLGEWHLHPGGTSQPSAQDILQMEKISKSDEYACAEPILLIIAGSSKGPWEYSACVIPRNANLLDLQQLCTGTW